MRYLRLTKIVGVAVVAIFVASGVALLFVYEDIELRSAWSIAIISLLASVGTVLISYLVIEVVPVV